MKKTYTAPTQTVAGVVQHTLNGEVSGNEITQPQLRRS